MCATLVRVDVISKGVHRLRIAIVPLKRDLDIRAAPVAFHKDRLLINRCFVLIEKCYK